MIRKIAAVAFGSLAMTIKNRPLDCVRGDSERYGALSDPAARGGKDKFWGKIKENTVSITREQARR